MPSGERSIKHCISGNEVRKGAIGFFQIHSQVYKLLDDHGIGEEVVFAVGAGDVILAELSARLPGAGQLEAAAGAAQVVLHVALVEVKPELVEPELEEDRLDLLESGLGQGALC